MPAFEPDARTRLNDIIGIPAQNDGGSHFRIVKNDEPVQVLIGHDGNDIQLRKAFYVSLHANCRKVAMSFTQYHTAPQKETDTWDCPRIKPLSLLFEVIRDRIPDPPLQLWAYMLIPRVTETHGCYGAQDFQSDDWYRQDKNSLLFTTNSVYITSLMTHLLAYLQSVSSGILGW